MKKIRTDLKKIALLDSPQLTNAGVYGLAGTAEQTDPMS